MLDDGAPVAVVNRVLARRYFPNGDAIGRSVRLSEFEERPPESIAAPRLETPRRRVPAGSVAIGGRQTGVYPVASPGGWRIIGRTPLCLFQPAAVPPVLLQMGDHVRFVVKGAI